GPAVAFELLLKRLDVRIVDADQHADTPDAFWFLGARCDRPRRRAKTDQEIASSHGHPETGQGDRSTSYLCSGRPETLRRPAQKRHPPLVMADVARGALGLEAGPQHAPQCSPPLYT